MICFAPDAQEEEETQVHNRSTVTDAVPASSDWPVQEEASSQKS